MMLTPANIKAFGQGILIGSLLGGFFILLSYLPLWVSAVSCIALGGGMTALGHWLGKKK